MIDNLPLPSLLAVLVAICALVAITGGWLFLLVSRSETKQVTLTGLGLSINIDTRVSGRRVTDKE